MATNQYGQPIREEDIEEEIFTNGGGEDVPFLGGGDSSGGMSFMPKNRAMMMVNITFSILSFCMAVFLIVASSLWGNLTCEKTGLHTWMMVQGICVLSLELLSIYMLMIAMKIMNEELQLRDGIAHGRMPTQQQMMGSMGHKCCLVLVLLLVALLSAFTFGWLIYGSILVFGTSVPACDGHIYYPALSYVIYQIAAHVLRCCISCAV